MAEAERPGTHMACVGVRSRKLWNGDTESREKCFVHHQYFEKNVSVELYEEVSRLMQIDVGMLSVVTKYHRPCSLKTRNSFFSQFWRLEVLGQVNTVGFWASPCVLTASFLCVYLCPNFFLEGHQSYWTMDHLNDLLLTQLSLQRPCLQTQPL